MTIMKRLNILALMTLMAVISVSAQVTKFFDKYADVEKVTSVYISKTMLRMMPDIKTGDMDMSGMAGKLDCVRVLTSDNGDMARKLKSELSKIVVDGGYELLVKVNEGKEKTNIYMKSDANGVNDYLIVNEDSSDFNAILIVGTLTPADIKKMTDK